MEGQQQTKAGEKRLVEEGGEGQWVERSHSGRSEGNESDVADWWLGGSSGIHGE
jgi:hypothetical protein